MRTSRQVNEGGMGLFIPKKTISDSHLCLFNDGSSLK